MRFSAKALYIKFSPFKLRPIVDVIRGKNAQEAINWLAMYRMRRVMPIKKLLDSVVANARFLKNVAPVDLIIKDIRIDHGPTYKYFKPGAQGRANIQKKRSSHMKIELVSIENEV